MIMTKRYLLFAGETYYACGGWKDFKDSFDAEEAATRRGYELVNDPMTYYDWYQVVDLLNNKIVDAVDRAHC